MRKLAIIIFVVLISVVMLTLFLGIRPINISVANTTTISDKVLNVSEAGHLDAVLHLEARKGLYYINRGLEHHFTLKELKESLVGQTVKIGYARHWTLLPGTVGHHITEVMLDDSLVYSELR